MGIALKKLKKDWFILSSLISKDFKIKYRRSVLGVLWSVLNPLLQMIVLSIVFSHMFKFAIDNFPLYLILGQTIFAIMANSTGQGVVAITGAASLIKKIRINKIIFPVEKVFFEVINFLISLIAVIAVIAFFRVVPTPNILFLPLLLLYVVLFSVGLNLLLSALTVFFRDLIHLWSVFLLAWTYLTPLFYPLDLLPEWLKIAMQFNPMYQYVNYFRQIALWGQTPSLTANLICLVMAVVTCLVGYLVFRSTQRKFILYV